MNCLEESCFLRDSFAPGRENNFIYPEILFTVSEHFKWQDVSWIYLGMKCLTEICDLWAVEEVLFQRGE